MLARWREFRRRQREALQASYGSSASQATKERGEPDLVADALAGDLPTADAADTADTAGPGPASASASPGGDEAGGAGFKDDQTPASTRPTPFGTAGRPLNRQSPFYIGFVGAIGVLVAMGLYSTLGRLATVITLLVVSLFLTLALNPLVQTLTARGLKRSLSVTAVFFGLIAVFALLGLIVVPPVVDQGGLLTEKTPEYLQQLLDNSLIQELDRNYNVTDRLQEEFQKRVTDGNFVSTVFGGVLGAGKAVANGFLSVFTVLVLTLYFLSALPKVKQAAYGMVPASRRHRVVSLSEEIMRRVGSYAIGQVAVASLNAVASWVMMTIVGINYAAVLAVAVGFLGLIPMVGATLGAAIVCLVAVFDEPKKAIIALVYYLVYQQIENYVIAPRIMQRTVSVPGAVTVVAALAGGTLLGVLGALLAIPVAAGLLLLYEEVLVPRQRRV